MSTVPTTCGLAELQHWLQAAVALPAATQNLALARMHVRATAQLSADARLGIYQVSYRARLLQSFHAIFPGLLQAMGQTLLDAFALGYLRARKPQHYSINRIADGFLDHLRRSRPPRDGTPPDWTDFLIELATVELSLLEVSEARGLEHVRHEDATHWRDLPGAILLDSRPRVATCARLLCCTHPVHDYLQALRANREAVRPSTRMVWLALTRTDYRLVTRELARVQWELLSRLDGRTCLGQVLERIQELDLRPAPTVELARLWLDNFSAQGLLQPGQSDPADTADGVCATKSI